MVTNLRGLIPGLRNKIYLNYGGQGPLPDPSLNEIIKSWKIIQNIGPFTNEIWPFISNEIIQTKLVLSKFLGVARKNIALSENISTGMILPLWGIRFKTGDEILISDCEHPGIVAACRELCRRNNLKLKILSIQKIKNLNDQEFLSETLRHINQKTNLFIISHVLWNYGYQIPLKKLRYELNKLSYEPYLIVDGAQSFGHIEIQDEVIEFVAKNINSNVRELEGAIISLIAQSSFNKAEITVDLAKEVINKFVKNNRREVSIDYIQKVVSDYFQMDIQTLQSKTRRRHIVQARQIAMYFAKKFTKASLASIGSQIGRRDHATVLHACKTVDNLSFTDKQFRKYVEDLNQKLSN